ncbi:SdpI family protein [Amphibacillus jilinensis]|uniref:SdpI family protein n=1 Tax=Amphibacillus jilinensis TaxID=1216008 RepID=UPI0002E7EBEF|nr:SdpI family protein [Amphibacillus jilinensis]
MNKHRFPLLLMGLAILFWLVFYHQLPEDMPMQWGADGSVNWTAPKLIALLFNIGNMVFMYLILYFIPKIDPKKKNYRQFSKAYYATMYGMVVLFFIINVFVVLTGAGYDFNIHILVPVLVGLFFIIFGNYMQTLKTNWFLGIRTPWTLDNEAVWRKTHRLTAKIFIIAGIIFVILPFLEESIIIPVFVVVLVIIFITPIAYSYLIHKKSQH